MVEVTTQKQLEAALKKEPNAEITLTKGRFEITVRGASRPVLIVLAGVYLSVSGYDGGRPQVTAWENSQVTAWGNSQVTARENSQVTAWENSQVTAWGNSQVTARENSQVTAWGNSQVTAWENSQVTAWGNSQVTAWGNSQVTAWGNSQVTARGNSQVTARENSQVTARENSQVTAWENSQVTAWGNSQVTAWENSQVTARGYAFVRVFSARKVEAVSTCIVALHVADGAAGMVGVGGGQQVLCPLPDTPRAWCDHYGVEISGDIALVYKAVDDDYSTANARAVGLTYAPGSTPIAPDWDGGRRECGGGLHFSPHPMMALEFHPDAKRFMACPVALADISVHPRGASPQKIKARGLIGPTYEVDRNGVAIAPAQAMEA
jgi:hypothetical protein